MQNLVEISKRVEEIADPRLNLDRQIELSDFSVHSMLADLVHGESALENFYHAVQEDLWPPAEGLRRAA